MLNTPETVHRSNANDSFLSLIETGGFSPGDRLPFEREPMVWLGLTPTTPRNALDKLKPGSCTCRHVKKGRFTTSKSVVRSPDGLVKFGDQATPLHIMRALVD